MIGIYDVIKRPILTESSMGHLDRANTYVFEVHRDATKVQVRNAVEKLFSVEVASVNTAIVKGKPIRRGRWTGHTKKWKKAFVTLGAGAAIELF